MGESLLYCSHHYRNSRGLYRHRARRQEHLQQLHVCSLLYLAQQHQQLYFSGRTLMEFIDG